MATSHRASTRDEGQLEPAAGLETRDLLITKRASGLFRGRGRSRGWRESPLFIGVSAHHVDDAECR